MQTTVSKKQEIKEARNLKKTWKNPWIIVVLALVLIGGGFTAFRALTGSNQGVNTANKTELVESKSLAIKIKASGSVVPIETVNLSPKQAGKLAELLV
ncbi:MAG: efflux transporter periplasmic adaptor subunit, partial [Pseudanabaena sp.]